jgi:hypothetical protein
MTPSQASTYIRFYQDYEVLMNNLESCETEEQVNSTENIFYNIAAKYSLVIEKNIMVEHEWTFLREVNQKIKNIIFN